MNSTPLQRKVLVTNPNGLHLRPSAAFVETAQRFQSRITVTHNGKSVNGRAVLDLMFLGAGIGSELTLEADGPDASEALEALALILAIIPSDEPAADSAPQAGGQVESV